MHFQIKERETALEISRARELFYWLASFYGVATVGLIGRFNSTKRAAVLAPIVPLSFLVAYYADLAYGTKIHRITGERLIMGNELCQRGKFRKWFQGFRNSLSVQFIKKTKKIVKVYHFHFTDI